MFFSAVLVSQGFRDLKQETVHVKLGAPANLDARSAALTGLGTGFVVFLAGMTFLAWISRPRVS